MTKQPMPLGVFDDLAEQYDRFRIGYAPELYEVLDGAGFVRGTRTIDIGCGTGIVSRELAAQGCIVTGVDISPPMLARARERVPNASFVESSSESLPFDDASFDAAASAQAFHWFDQPRALAEISRVVRPGGSVAIWWKGLMRGDATRLLRERAAKDLGLTGPPELLTEEFGSFESSGLIDRRLRVIPWLIRTTVARFIGYERSRARARDAYGLQLEAYVARLEQLLGSPDTELSIAYVQLLYLGRVPETR